MAFRDTKYYMTEVLTKKQQKMFEKLDNTQTYTCVDDRQGGEFALWCVMTVKEWVHQALEWEDSDGCIDCDQRFINELLKGGENAIKMIDEFWDITIVKSKEARA